MNTKTLSELEFNEIINESYAQTQTGEDLLNKYKAYLMSNSCSYGLVNSFVKEAQLCKYDNGVYIQKGYYIVTPENGRLNYQTLEHWFSNR